MFLQISSIESKILMPLRQKHKNKDLKKLCFRVEYHLLHCRGTVCIVETICLANLGGSGLHSGGSWRPRIPSLKRGYV